MKSNIYSIGEDEPFKLTKESAFNLAKAIVKTNSTIIASGVDSTCPPTHIYMRVSIQPERVATGFE